jgi:hypothetical protein
MIMSAFQLNDAFRGQQRAGGIVDRDPIPVRLASWGFFIILTVWWAILGIGAACPAATSTMSVAGFGAIGDAARITVRTTSNSPVVVTTNQFSNSDIGKVMCLFGAGAYTTPTNNQDLVATIVSVRNGTNVTIGSVAGATSNNIPCTYGTQNATAFQACINAAPTNSTILIPAGNYLLLPPQALNTKFAMPNSSATYPAVTISKGGLHFLGAGQTNTVLIGNGAWQNKGAYAFRGCLFFLQGPVTNDAPLIFDSLTMDGGVLNGQQSYNYFPARTTDGAGWDMTHDAVLDIGAPLHLYKSFTNCTFTRWRGEMVKSVSGWTNGFIDIGNCAFLDGNASAINFSFSHIIHDCSFVGTKLVMEFYQAYCATPCVFSNNLISNMAGAALAFNGAVTNRVIPSYYVCSNRFFLGSADGIYTSPVNNLYITGNQFYDGNTGVSLGTAGYQGTAMNSNIVIQFNTFSNTFFVLQIEGNGQDSSANVLVCSNTATVGNSFAYGNGWGTNISFVGNVANGILNSTQLSGQWYPDNVSNQFPPYQENDVVGVTNVISYAFGIRHQIWANAVNAVYKIDDSSPKQIPPGAVLLITNSIASRAVPLYLSSSMSGVPRVMNGGDAVTCIWTNGAWQLFTQVLPPSGLHVITNAP